MYFLILLFYSQVVKKIITESKRYSQNTLFNGVTKDPSLTPPLRFGVLRMTPFEAW